MLNFKTENLLNNLNDKYFLQLPFCLFTNVCLFFPLQVCGAFGLALFGDIYFGFAVCALLMEISSIFLHSRKLLMFHGFAKKSLPFQVNGIFLLVTFIFFRFLTSAWMTNFVIQNRHQMPFSHFLQGTINMAILTVVNVVLLMTIYNSDFQNEKQINKQEQ